MEQLTLEQLKESLDIVQIAELYGELIKSGANYKYKDDKSIIINETKQMFSDFNGSITGGSVLDLITYMEKCDLAAGIKRLKELNGQEIYQVDPALKLKRKEEANREKVVDFQKLGLFAQNDLKAGQSKKPFVVEDETTNQSYLSVNPTFTKLFETDKLPLDTKLKLDYLHSKIIGYDEFFKCSSIIIRDRTGKVVDKCAYRPNQPEGYDKWTNPKYIHKNSHNRGQDFLYPFQVEVEKIIKRERYLIVGEGIKNAINALLYSAPFISVESSSNSTNKEFIKYINSYIDRGFSIIYMFDGDKAGQEAFIKFREVSGINADNYLSFDSGIDFTDYLLSSES